MSNNVSKEIVIQTAADLADKQGLQALSLKSIADELGIKSPSLYKHVKGGIDEIRHELVLMGWQGIDDATLRATAGKSGDDAIFALCNSFRSYAKEHPGIFEAIQWHNSYTSQENGAITKGVIATLYQILGGYHMDDETKMHVLRGLRAIVEGYTLIEIHQGFGDPVSIDESFDQAVLALIRGFSRD